MAAGGGARSEVLASKTAAAVTTRRPEPLAGGLAGATMALQRRAGNRAVGRLVVQRVDGPKLLTDGQVVRALSFYEMDPKSYTTDIISQLQGAVGTTPTGVLTPDDVQAVAAAQVRLNVDQSPALKIDGMAGPRTLPQMFRIGLAKDATLDAYAKQATDAWKDTSKSEEAIAGEIVQTLMQPRLAELGLPPVGLLVADGLGFRGSFSQSEWLLRMDQSQFRPGPHHDLKETTSTIYHECRHAEQGFKVAQMLAGQGRTADQITAATHIRLDVAQKAVTMPLAPGTMEALIAKGWFDSRDSAAGNAAIAANNGEMDAAFAARDKAKKAFDADKSPANQAALDQAKARYAAAVAVHDDLPHEFDAERLETRVEHGVDAANATPAPASALGGKAE